MKTDEAGAAPFTHPINVRTLPKKGQRVKYTAPDNVCAAIALEHDLISVESFEGECLISPWKRDGVELVGEIRANVVQPCAVSSEPLKATIREEITTLFAPEGSKLVKPQLSEDGEWVISAEGEDPPETFYGDSIDVGAVLLEYFVLGLDLYARLPGVEFSAVVQESGADFKEQSPFAVLSSLKKH